MVNKKRLSLSLPPAGSPEKSFDEKVKDEQLKAQKIISSHLEVRHIQNEARWQTLCDLMKDAVTSLVFTPPKPVTFPKKTNYRAEDAVLLLSDIQYGKCTPTYNFETAKKRINHIFNSVFEIVDIHRHAYPINNLHIICLGDMVDGESIYPTQAHHIDAPLVDQLFLGAPNMVDNLARAASHFENVYCYGVPGNHGRLGRFDDEVSNFDRIFYKIIELATANVGNIHWSITPKWYDVVKIMNTQFLAVHGHQIKMTFNLPWYGITTRISRWATTAQVGNFDAVCMGHFHVSSNLAWNNKHIFTNGTTIAGDEFALELLGMESSESQWFFGVHPERITWKYCLGF